MRIENSKADYDNFRAFLQEACGILLGDNKEYLVNSRLKPVIEKYDLSGLGELVSKIKLRTSMALREEVIDAMTTNETLWFRDLHPFRILEEMIFPEFGKKLGSQPLRIWSAACSTGQEPYSIAITGSEYKQKFPSKLNGNLQITATDISSSVLEKAKAGVYEMLALGRGMSPERLKKYFSENTDESWTIDRKLRQCVDFKSLNLLESYGKLGAKYDVVFCRNVLIYFSAESKLDILSRMHSMIKPGGYLILGASESLNGLPDKYEMVQCRPGIIYRAR